MKSVNNILLVAILSISSACIYLIQLNIFHKPEDTLFYLFQDLAFVPVQAIIVTLVLNKLLNIIEKQQKLKKINVIISAFFAEAGTSILFALSKHNENRNGLYGIIEVEELDKNSIKTIKKKVKEFNYKINIIPDKLESLRDILAEKKSFMIDMLENPSLLEHDSFTDMLWSVFHVADELQSRESLKDLSQNDLEHLALDILRAYTAIISEWINYLKYLKNEYPYLFNLAIRKNPFSENKEAY